MPNFTTLDGQTLAYGKQEGYSVDDEKAFTLSLDKQVRAADLNNKQHVMAIKKNLNQISKLLELDQLSEDGNLDEPAIASIQYFQNNAKLFKEHGISQHIDAKKLEKMTNPAFTETEYAPTIDEMKKLEINIDELYS
tara:strand:- start:81 stop:491 length:411 start_codon:yes stop_codon:yes gene_type:complete